MAALFNDPFMETQFTNRQNKTLLNQVFVQYTQWHNAAEVLLFINTYERDGMSSGVSLINRTSLIGSLASAVLQSFIS